MTATLLSALLLLVLIVPAIYLGQLVVENSVEVAGHLRGGLLTVPPPPRTLLQWPLIGKPIHGFWSMASTNLGAALELIAPQVKLFATWLLSAAASTGLAVLQFIFSIIVAGLLLAQGDSGRKMVLAVARRFAGARGAALNQLAVATIRGVASGVLGVAMIQSILAGLGFVVAGIPGAGLDGQRSQASNDGARGTDTHAGDLSWGDRRYDAFRHRRSVRGGCGSGSGL